MPDSHLIDSFLEMLSVERNASANTLAAYRRDLEQFSDALALRGVGLLEAQTDDLRTCLKALSAKGLGPSTHARKLSAMRQFFRFAYSEGLRGDDPSAILKSPKPGRPLPKVLGEDRVTLLLDRAETEARSTRGSLAARTRCARLHALLELLYATGLRVSELVGLPVSVLSTKDVFLIVRGKGDKERLVPFSSKARSALDHYAALRSQTPGWAVSPFLFPATGANGHLSRQHFARDLKDLASRTDLDARAISPHVLRHAFASHLLQNGADLRSVQQLLGHADIATTQIYTHVLENRLRDLVETAHPMSQHAV